MERIRAALRQVQGINGFAWATAGIRASGKNGIRCSRRPAAAVLALAAIGFGQTSPGVQADHTKASESISFTNESADEPFHVVNPFSTPWLLRELGQIDATAQPSSKIAVADDAPLAKSKYKLEPDPFSSELSQSSSSDDAHPSMSSVPAEPDTAERLAAAVPKMERPKTTREVKSKYDVNRIGDRGIGANLNFYSIDKEEALGRELSQQFEQQAKLIKDPVITEYVNRIGQILVQHSDAKVPFTIKVVDDEQVNAFALPGGFFYVNTGVILAADNEAELAGVMAHEIAHVAARHATRNATKQEIWNLASIPLIFVGGPVAVAIRQASGIVVPLSFLKFSRDAEREADFLGIQYEYASGYDPTALIDFFEKLESQEKQKSGLMARAFATHPMNDDRIHRAEAELETLPSRDDYIVTTSEFDQVKLRLIRVTRGRTISDGKSQPVLRKHTSQDEKPPILKKNSIPGS